MIVYSGFSSLDVFTLLPLDILGIEWMVKQTSVHSRLPRVFSQEVHLMLLSLDIL